MIAVSTRVIIVAIGKAILTIMNTTTTVITVSVIVTFCYSSCYSYCHYSYYHGWTTPSFQQYHLSLGLWPLGAAATAGTGFPLES